MKEESLAMSLLKDYKNIKSKIFLNEFQERIFEYRIKEYSITKMSILENCS